MCVDVPSASSGDLSGGVKDNVFLKYRYGYGQLQLVLENDPPRNKKKDEKNVKKFAKYTSVYGSSKSYNISLSLYREREKKEAEVHALGSNYVISFSLVSPFLFLPFRRFSLFLSRLFCFSYNLILCLQNTLSPLSISLFFYMLSVTLYIYATVNEFHVSFKSRS